MIETLGYLGLAGFLWLTLFQIALACGAPLGHMAWGGRHRVLPPRFRKASAASAVLTLLSAIMIAQTAGIGPVLLPEIFERPFLGAVAVLFAVSLVGNAISDSRIERLHGVPLTLLLAVTSAGVAILA
ncbi:MAG: hypothetical protein AAF376_18955 [Pseudomonadota bacterium]